MKMVNVGLIGCGYWGKNYVNTINNMPQIKLKYVHDLCEPSLKNTNGFIFTRDINEVLNDDTVRGVIIATPTETHYEISLQALHAGKHVLVEKPLTTSSDNAQKLCDVAEQKDSILMTGHIFMYNEALLDIKNRIANGDIGVLRYIESRRVGLGPIRYDVSVLWDFVTHDIYISTFLIGESPLSVSCNGQSHNKKLDDIVSLNMKFKKDIFVSIYANWEHPIKERKIIIGGDKKAILFDDVQPSEKVAIYDRGINYLPSSGDFGEFQATTREGDIVIPRLKMIPPLEQEVNHFIYCIKSGKKCNTSGLDALNTIKILETAELSKTNGGREIELI
jgi:predicted dehydrogenase